MHKIAALARGHIAIRAFIGALVLAGLKLAFDLAEIEFFESNPVLPSLLGGTIVLMGFLLAAVLADFKEAEKTPTEVSTLVRNIYDEGVYFKGIKPAFNLDRMRAACHGVVASFLSELSHGGGVPRSLEAVSGLNAAIQDMERLGMAPPLLARLKVDQGNLRRAMLRASYIKENSFVGAAYFIAQAATLMDMVFLFLFRTSPTYEATVLVLSVGFLLIYMLFLIRDMDDPFEFKEGRRSGFKADVNPAQLLELRQSLGAPDVNLGPAAPERGNARQAARSP